MTTTTAARPEPAWSGKDVPDRSWVEIDLEQLRRNAAAVRAGVPNDVIAVVKGDGYGLGLLHCVDAFVAAGINSFAVGDLDEAQRLRHAGVTGTIIVLSPPAGPWSYRSDQVDWLIGSNDVQPDPGTRVHIDIDLGTGRGGISPQQVPSVIERLTAHGIEITGLAAHLPSDPSLDRWTDAAARLTLLKRSHADAVPHVGGSDVLRWAARIPGIAVRVGRLLYGIAPRLSSTSPPVRQAYSWLAHADAYPPATSVGYAAARVPAGVPVRLSVGFADGLPPQAAGRWPVLINGERYLIYEVFMLSSVAYPLGRALTPGQRSVGLLLGRSGSDEVPIREVATLLGLPTTAVLMLPRSPRRTAA